MSMLCNCCVRELLILARTWFAFGLPSKTGCDTYVRANVAVGEVLLPCSCDVVAVGGALEPCGSIAVGAIGSLLTSPCFRKGLRTAVVMEHAGCHHYLFYRGEPDGTLVLFPVA
jgi:hypothetical protein